MRQIKVANQDKQETNEWASLGCFMILYIENVENDFNLLSQ